MRLLKALFVRFGLLLLLYSCFRWVFYLVYRALFPSPSAEEFLMILLNGMRFDAVAVVYLNAIPFILEAMPYRFNSDKVLRLIQQNFFIVFNAFGLFLILTDFAFFPFNMKRLDSEVLGLIGSIPTMMGAFFTDYYYLFLLFPVFIYGLLLIYRKTAHAEESPPTLKSAVIPFLVVIGLLILGLRGGIQPRPIRPVMAANHIRPELSSLVTNSVFTFIYSVTHRNLIPKEYFSEAEVGRIYPIRKQADGNAMVSSEKPNIVLIILESFSSTCIGHLGAKNSLTPHLDSISKESFVFKRAYANGRRSSQGLVALTAGFPALMDDPLMYSPYVNNRFYGLPKLLKEEGYHSYFFNGSEKGLLGWTDYINSIGYDQYVGKEEYPNDEHYDGYWGIYDHYFLEFFADQMKGLERPYFSTIFTLSSHHPFHIPPALKQRFEKTEVPFYNSLLYTDWALANFLEKARSVPDFKNTIFIVIADHTYSAEAKSPEKVFDINDEKINRVNLYHIPMLIYAPSLINPGSNEKVVQQTDVFDLVIDLSGYSGDYYSFGQSPLKQGSGLAFEQVKGVYQLIQDEYVLVMKDGSAEGLYRYPADINLENNLVEKYPEQVKKMENIMKAIIQQHDNSLIKNNLRL